MNIFCYTHNIADFRRDTAHLTHEQRGIYRDLLDSYYFNAGNLTADLNQLARIISVQTESERTALAFVVCNFFVIKHDRLTQKRADEEIARIRDKSIKAKASANSKHKKDKEKETSVRTSSAPPTRTANGDANDLLTMNHEPITIDSKKPPTPSGFERFWDAYPKARRDSKPKSLPAYKRAITKTTEDEIYAATLRYAQSDEVARGFAKGTIAWLNAERWRVGYQPPQQSVNGGGTYVDSLKTASSAAHRYVTEQEKIRAEAG